MDPDKYSDMLSQQSKWKYGIDFEDRDLRLAEQGGVCAICRTDCPQGRGWVIDHDHACCDGIKTCGKCIRGILCTNCNSMLGQAKDNPDTLIAAAMYIMQNKDLLAGLSSSGQPQLSAAVSRRTAI